MKLRMLFVLSALLASLSGIVPVRAGWGTSGCAPVGAYASPSYTWQDHGDCQLLYRNGIQVGGWREATREFRTFNAQTQSWSEPMPAPWQEPEGACPSCPTTGELPANNIDPFNSPSTRAIPPMGLQSEELSKQPTLWYGTVSSSGVSISAEVPNLATKPYLTVVSADKAKRELIMSDIQRSSLGERFRVQAKDPSHWHMKPFKLGEDGDFKRSGLVMIAQSPPEKPGRFGQVKQSIYEWKGVEDLERKVDPNYKPDRSSPESSGTSPVLWLAGIAACLLLIPRRTETIEDV